ncbi:MAG TPA: TRAP transporter large permease [Candidatus Limiplasma sp.]|nr:TRAP transporter large permease [Candidatus Limiplasma sp.]HRX09071.1 TRAP transporter large permease [Candidatus Limiplasma sp.]
MSPEVVGLLGIALLLVLIALKVPISFAMIISGFLGFGTIISFPAAINLLPTEIYSTFSSYSLSVIPMFIWMGFIAYHSGIGAGLFRFAHKMVGHKPGGLAMATQAACALFGAICGSNTATAATMGAIALPEMRKYGYDDSLSSASIAAGGALGVIIPPSVIFIVYGIATQQSIGKLFIAGIVPGILLMLLYMLAIYIVVKRRPSYGPVSEKASWKERVQTLGDGLFEVMFIFLFSLGGLFAGWFTPTEAGAIGTACILLVTVLRKHLSLAKLRKSLIDAVRTTAMIMLMVAGAMFFGRFIAVSRLPILLAQWAAGLPLPSFAIIGVILVVYLILGCFIDALALILLTIPIFYPVAVNTLGYDPIWFGVIIVLVVAMGVITPPVGMNVFIVKGVAGDIPTETIFKGVWPFVIALVACIALLIAFPQIVTFLPNLL